MSQLDQSSIFPQCHSQRDLQYIETVLRDSLEKTPLKDISGIYDEENPEMSSNILSKIKNKKKYSSPYNINGKKQVSANHEKIEQLMTLEYKIFVESFKDKATKEEYPLRHNSSYFQCLSNNFGRFECNYRFRTQSTFELYIKQETNAQQLIYCINFDTISTKIRYAEENKQSYIIIDTGSHELTISAQSSEGQYLKKKIQIAHKVSMGNELKLGLLLARPQYFKQRFDTQEFFIKNCSTGDILLFQDNHFFAKLQRFITGSNFNHVGMVIRDSHYGILIFESNSKTGVCLTQWKSLISNRWYTAIPKISWRRLTKVSKNILFENTIKRFLMENLQKSFHISTRALMANESVIIPEDEGNEESYGFFCSELIATLYKNLGLLTRDRGNPNYQPACKFYPKDFSELSGRQLDQGELSPQSQIYFDRQLLERNYPQYFPFSEINIQQ